MILYQLGGDIWGNIIWFILFIAFALFYPRIMTSQILFKLEQSASMLENFTVRGKKIVLKKIAQKPTKEISDAISNFMEFFVIEPVSLDPFGIVKKIEHIVNLQEKRFKEFARQVAPKMNTEEQANLVMGLSGAISLNQVAKIVRHYVETIKKTKNLQLAMVLQMQLPMIERISKALLKGTEALTNGWPIGDGAGPLVASYLIGDSKSNELEEDTLVARKKIKGRTVFIVRAKGPGGRLGKLGKIVDDIIRKEKISKIITVDAAAKLEGEKTGSIAEGVGVAIGGIGVDRVYIENVSAKKEIPLDTYVIKMSQEEAIQPMAKDVLVAVPKVVKLVEDNVQNSRGKVIVVGVGNCTGIGNTEKDAKKSEKMINDVLKVMAKRSKEEKKSRWSWLTGY
jgi:hypothetical protein